MRIVRMGIVFQVMECKRLHQLLLSDDCDTRCSSDQKDTRHYHHRGLMTTYQGKDDASTECGNNLWNTDGTIE